IGVIDRAGIERDQIVEAAAIEWQIFDFALTNEPGYRCRRRVDQRSLGRNGYFLCEISDLEFQIDDGFLSDGQGDSRSHGSAEPRLFAPDFLRADRQRENSVISRLIRRDCSCRAGFEILYDDG